MAISCGVDMGAIIQDEEVVRDQLGKISDNLEGAVAQELQEIMLQVQQLAVELCPKETGALASSISLEGGAISASNGDFFDCSIYAGSEDVVNPISGKPTSEYAMLVHDGHMMRDGDFWEGVPFLEEAMMTFEPELEACVNKALASLTSGD